MVLRGAQPLNMRFGSLHPYDVIVCGAGHAGCEAALAAARMGADTLILSGNIDTIAQMSCNPAIGGLAKGNIVREIDALGGAMAHNTDFTGIQFRLLNASKGLAVQGPRAQCDKKAYQFRMKHLLELQRDLTIFQAIVTGLIYKNGTVIGVKTNLDIDFYAKTVVVTTGTFLRGLMHVGANKNEGGRMGDFTSKSLSSSFLEAGIQLQRLKTGTPPRILGSSIDFQQVTEQPGDASPTLFGFYDSRGIDPTMFHVEHVASARQQLGARPDNVSKENLCSTWNINSNIRERTDVPRGTSFWQQLVQVTLGLNDKDMFHVEHKKQEMLGWMPGSNQMSCWTTDTTVETAEIVRANLSRSALYGGEIQGTGPRYCPSIEDKVVKFADKEQHKVFLEPEGRNTDEWYINGLSTSLPFDVQVDMLRSIKGLQNVQLLRPAYAVEYDFAPPTQLWPSLESRKVENLFFAGQINGTSGYEEAAGQGLVAGINAAAKVKKVQPLILQRHESYIGVLIDDLVTKGTLEPYRMFTSRAEHRLLLNHGSAELRLWRRAKDFQVVDEKRLARMEAAAERAGQWEKKFEKGPWAAAQRRGEEASLDTVPEGFMNEPVALREEILYKIRYRGYIERENRAVEKMGDLDKVLLPKEIDYLSLPGLRKESAMKLNEAKPANLGQASRMSGVNPTDVTILMLAVRKG